MKQLSRIEIIRKNVSIQRISMAGVLVACLVSLAVAGSPAIDAGNPSGCRDNAGMFLPTDQRGFARPADGNNDGTVRCDIGAYEANAVISNNAAFVFQQYSIFLIGGPTLGKFPPG